MKRRALAALLLVLAVVAVACSTGEVARPRSDEATGDDGAPPSVTAASQALRRCDALGAPAVSAEKVKTCLSAGREAASCVEPLFATYLKDHTTQQALAVLQCLMDADDSIRGSCHPAAHAIGRDTFAVQGTVEKSFAACDQTCIAGCYHGAMERFLRGNDDTGGHISLAELQAKAATACDPSLPIALRFQCLHGLGHAIMYYTGYALHPSLTICDATGDDWSQSSCAGGVFMENVVAADPKDRDLSPTDYHYPCDAVEERYKTVCYLMQTTVMANMGLTPAQIFVECRNAGAYRAACLESLGRETSNLALINGPRAASSVCELGQGADLEACTEGCMKTLVGHSWDGRYAFPYCASYATPEAVSYCFTAAMSFLETNFGRTTGDLAAECAQYVPGNVACAAAVNH